MKKLIITIMMVFLSVSCKPSGMAHDYTNGLKEVLEKYFNWYGEYPPCLDSLVAFCNTFPIENIESADSLSMAIDFIKKEKQNLKLDYSNPTVMTEKLLITMDGDTIVNMQQKKHLSFLWELKRTYEFCNYDAPRSFEDIMTFFNVMKEVEDDTSFYRCCASTLRYLEKNNYRISWQFDDDCLYMISDGDTIDYFCGYHPCVPSDWRARYEFRYFDIKSVYIPDNDIDAEFRKGLKMLKEEKDFVMPNEDRSQDPALVFTLDKGLQLYCENITADLDSEWFKVLSDYCRHFAESHGVGKIIFASPCYQRSN